MKSKLLNYLSSDWFLLKLTERIGAKAKKLIKSEFTKSQNPYDEKWVKRKDKDRHKILVKTGELKGSFNVVNDINGVTIFSNSTYGGFHQTGTKDLPQRMILPDKDMPDRWAEEFKLTFDELINKLIAKYSGTSEPEVSE